MPADEFDTDSVHGMLVFGFPFKELFAHNISFP